MIKHLVMVKLDQKDNQGLTDDIITGFQRLEDQIDVVQSIDVEKNAYIKRESNFDLLFTVTLDDIEDLESYLYDDDHVNFAQTVLVPNTQSISTFDYEQ